MQVDVRRANDLIPQLRYLLYRLEQSTPGWRRFDIIRSLDSVDSTRYICVLSNFKVFLYFEFFEVTFQRDTFLFLRDYCDGISGRPLRQTVEGK